MSTTFKVQIFFLLPSKCIIFANLNFVRWQHVAASGKILALRIGQHCGHRALAHAPALANVAQLEALLQLRANFNAYRRRACARVNEAAQIVIVDDRIFCK